MVFCSSPDETSPFRVARSATQIINSYALNMRALSTLGTLLYSCLYIDTCMP